jgi:hypothetical protein
MEKGFKCFQAKRIIHNPDFTAVPLSAVTIPAVLHKPTKKIA